MPYQDSNPERRNLVVSSLCIAVYCFAGGVFESDSIRLQVVNVAFERGWVLTLSLWVMFAWFIFRHWVVNSGEWKESFLQSLCHREANGKILYLLLKKRFSLGEDYSKAYREDRHWLSFDRGKNNSIIFRHVYQKEGGGQQQDQVIPKTFLDYIIVIVCYVRMFFVDRTLSEYFIPYLLALTAIVSAFLDAKGIV